MYEMNRRNIRPSNVYNPFREMEELQRNFFGDPFAHYNHSDALAEFRTDVIDEGNYFLLESDLPGFDKKDIHLSINGDTLTIRAERHSRFEDSEQKEKFVRTERTFGSYSRQFSLNEIDTNHIRASYENGVLSLVLPKKQPDLPKSRTLTID